MYSRVIISKTTSCAAFIHKKAHVCQVRTSLHNLLEKHLAGDGLTLRACLDLVLTWISGDLITSHELKRWMWTDTEIFSVRPLSGVVMDAFDSVGIVLSSSMICNVLRDAVVTRKNIIQFVKIPSVCVLDSLYNETMERCLVGGGDQ